MYFDRFQSVHFVNIISHAALDYDYSPGSSQTYRPTISCLSILNLSIGVYFAFFCFSLFHGLTVTYKQLSISHLSLFLYLYLSLSLYSYYSEPLSILLNPPDFLLFSIIASFRSCHSRILIRSIRSVHSI